MSKQNWIPLLFFSLVIVYYYFTPDNGLFFLQCPLYQSTGLSCPGCGSQRALHSLLNGEILWALETNLLFIMGLIACLYHVISSYLYSTGTTSHKSIFKNKKVIIVTIILVVLFGILRNIRINGSYWLGP